MHTLKINNEKEKKTTSDNSYKHKAKQSVWSTATMLREK